jgi:hypothetical protein
MSTNPTANVKGIIEEVNILRSDPKKYSDKLERYKTYFTDDIIQIPEMDVQVSTQEGVVPYTETIEYLKKQEPVEQLKASRALCEIAQEILDKVVDSETGEIEESEVEKIIDSHGNFSGKFTRAMDFGGFTSEQIVINFIVCDGDPERTQRDPLLGKGLTKVGVAFGKHNIYSTVCVFVSCTEFESNNSDDTPIFNDVKFSIDDESEEEKKRKEKEEREKEEREKEEREKEEREKEKKKEKEREKAIEEGKRREEEKKKEEQKKKEEGKKKEGVRKKLSITNQNGDLFKLPKKKFFAFNSVEKDQLPEGVASMTTRDTIIIEGGKRYKKIIINKVMIDGTKTIEEVKECLD